MASVVAQHTKEFIIRQHNTADNVNAINEDDFDAMSDREALETILRALAPRSAEACTNLIKQTERSTVHDNSDRSTAKLATFVSYRETMRQNYDLTRNLVDSPTFKKTFLDNLFDPTLKALLKVLIADPIISAAQFMDFCIDEATKKQRHEHEAKAANSNSSYSISALEHSRYAQQSRENSRGRDDNRRFSRDNNLSSSLSAFRHDSSRDRDRRDYSSSQARDDSRGRYQQRNSSRHGYDRISSRNRDARADSQPRNDRSRSRERVESRDRGRDQQRDRSQDRSHYRSSSRDSRSSSRNANQRYSSTPATNHNGYGRNSHAHTSSCRSNTNSYGQQVQQQGHRQVTFAQAQPRSAMRQPQPHQGSRSSSSQHRVNTNAAALAHVNNFQQFEQEPSSYYRDGPDGFDYHYR